MIQSISHHSLLENRSKLTRFEVGTNVRGHIYECLDENTVDVSEICSKNPPIFDQVKSSFFSPSTGTESDNETLVAESSSHKVSTSPCKSRPQTPTKSKILVHAELFTDDSIEENKCSASPMISSVESSDEVTSKHPIHREYKNYFSFARKTRPQGLSPNSTVIFTEALVKVMDEVAENKTPETARDIKILAEGLVKVNKCEKSVSDSEKGK